MQSETAFSHLKDFFSSPQAQKTAVSLRAGAEIAILVDGLPSFCLRKSENALELSNEIPDHPDLTFFLGVESPARLKELKNEEIGTLGVSIFKLMVSEDPREKIRLSVHADFFQLARNGYFKVLAEGGPQVMRFLAEKGLGNFSKIKSIISQLKDK